MDEKKERDVDGSAKVAKLNDVNTSFTALDFPDYGAHHAEPFSDFILCKSGILASLPQLLNKDFVVF